MENDANKSLNCSQRLKFFWTFILRRHFYADILIQILFHPNVYLLCVGKKCVFNMKFYFLIYKSLAFTCFSVYLGFFFPFSFQYLCVHILCMRPNCAVIYPLALPLDSDDDNRNSYEFRMRDISRFDSLDLDCLQLSNAATFN